MAHTHSEIMGGGGLEEAKRATKNPYVIGVVLAAVGLGFIGGNNRVEDSFSGSRKNVQVSRQIILNGESVNITGSSLETVNSQIGEMQKEHAEVVEKQIAEQKSKMENYRTMAEKLVINTEDPMLKKMYIEYAMLAIERGEEVKKVEKKYSLRCFNRTWKVPKRLERGVKELTGNEWKLFQFVMGGEKLYAEWEDNVYKFIDRTHYEQIIEIDRKLGKVADRIKSRLGIR
ncbi:MAG: hypothetical protein KAI16_01965 [Candidatus Pacebacteria bacterium]|nr:hypothetical protein [Candidatus Paceibacterota bacterium]